MGRLFLSILMLTVLMSSCTFSGSFLPSEPSPTILVPSETVPTAIVPTAVIPTLTVPTATVTLTVYFTDMARYQDGREPYEVPVKRTVKVSDSAPDAVLSQLFLGPTKAEKALGLQAVLSGTDGFSKLTIENGVAHVFLTGTCASNGATYTIANLIRVNLQQFPEIQWIKIYDQNNSTEIPEGLSDSIPVCLEP